MTPPPGSVARTPNGLVSIVTKLLESVGLLNAGSSKSAPTPTTGEAAQTTGISTNSLNVTRVGGIASLIAAAGAAALAVFNVNKTKDDFHIVVAAYISVGLIIAAALFTAAIIISADIRSRVAVNLGTQPNPGPSATAASATDAKAFSDTWKDAIDALRGAHTRLRNNEEDPFNAWLDGCATSVGVSQLHPTSDQQKPHARLQSCQSRVLSKLESLIGEHDKTRFHNAQADIQLALDNMERILQS